MATDFDLLDLGKYLGTALQSANKYKDDFIETEEVTDITLAQVESIELAHEETIKRGYVTGCDVTGVNGGINPFVIDHPVQGNIDGPFYIDGTYCSQDYAYWSEGLGAYLIYGVGTYIVDENGNFIIGLE